MNSPPANLLPALRLGAPHGLKGLLRAQVLLAQPAVLIGLALASRQADGTAGPKVTLGELKPHVGGGALVTVTGVADRTAAEQLVGLTLLLPRDLLPPVGADEIYLGDLLGRPVHDLAGVTRGTITALHATAGQDLLEVTLLIGGKKLVPAKAEFFADLRAELLILSELGQQVIEL